MEIFNGTNFNVRRSLHPAAFFRIRWPNKKLKKVFFFFFAVTMYVTLDDFCAGSSIRIIFAFNRNLENRNFLSSLRPHHISL